MLISRLANPRGPEQPPLPILPSSEVYAEFYRQYSRDKFGGELALSLGNLWLDGHVLHFDSPADHSVHIFAHEAAGSRHGRGTFHRDAEGQLERHYVYDSDGFTIATTDGTDIIPWQVTRATGVHRGPTVGIQYYPEQETVSLDLLHDGMVARLAVTKAGAHGLMRFDPQGCVGWILNAEISALERAAALPSAERDESIPVMSK